MASYYNSARDDDRGRAPSSRHRGERSPSPDYVHASGLTVTAPPVADTYLQYGPPPYSHGALYRPRSVPADRHRTSSRSPSPHYEGGRGRRDERSRSLSRSRSRSSGLVTKARNTVQDTFTNTPSGIGVGVLGAILGGLAAHGAADATARSRSSPREHQKARLISTVVGAAVGGLGANAFEKKRANRQRDRERELEETSDVKEKGARHRETDGFRYEGSSGQDRRSRRYSHDGRDNDDDYFYERRVSTRTNDIGPLRPGW